MNDDLTKKRAKLARDQLNQALIKTGAGDRAAFEFLYKQTSAKLFGVCLRIFSDRNEAEDALQDAYINIWNRAAGFQAGQASPISWLVAVTRNRAIDRLRSRGKTVYAPIEDADLIVDPAPLADIQIEHSDDDGALYSCIETLEQRDAQFIKAAFVSGSTYADLSAHENIPLGTVKSRIRRALLKLRKCLGEQL